MTLEKEAEKYAKSARVDFIYENGLYYGYIAGATSKYVQKQRVEAIIWTLEELRNIDTVKYIDPKINELQEQLKKIRNDIR